MQLRDKDEISCIWGFDPRENGFPGNTLQSYFKIAEKYDI